MSADGPLAGIRILFVEDNSLEAQDMAQSIRDASGIVVGPVPTNSDALGLLDTEEVHGAVLSINLADGNSNAVRRRLTEKGIPFVLVTGFVKDALPPDLGGVSYIQKPFERRAFVAVLALTINGLAQRHQERRGTD
jgi:DNA-binding response OmpR family regulator